MKDYSRYISNLRRSNPDIAETILSKYRRMAVTNLLWAVFITLIETLWLYEYFSSRINQHSAIIIWILLYFIPFIAMKRWQLLFDKTWVGKVVSVKYDREVKVSPNGRRVISYKNVLEMTVDCGKKVHTVKLPCATAQALYPYEVGDIVCRYRGTKFPVFAVASRSGAQLCPLCGTIHKPHELECFWCHHSVIKPSKRQVD